MNKARSSLDKPPLAVSPRRLRPRRNLRSDPPPTSPPAPTQAENSQRSPPVVKYEQISHDIDDSSAEAVKSFSSVAKLAVAPRTAILERGRMYAVYAARRNERLKRKMEESDEAVSLRRSIAVVEVEKRKNAKRTDSLRQSLPQDFVSGASSRLASSVTSSRVRNGSSSVLRSSMKLKIDGEKPLYFRSSIRK